MAEHKITSLGSKRLGYTWECSCGVTSQVTFGTTEERREDAARHREAGVEPEEHVVEIPPTGEVDYVVALVTTPEGAVEVPVEPGQVSVDLVGALRGAVEAAKANGAFEKRQVGRPWGTRGGFARKP